MSKNNKAKDEFIRQLKLLSNQKKVEKAMFDRYKSKRKNITMLYIKLTTEKSPETIKSLNVKLNHEKKVLQNFRNEALSSLKKLLSTDEKVTMMEATTKLNREHFKLR